MPARGPAADLGSALLGAGVIQGEEVDEGVVVGEVRGEAVGGGDGGVEFGVGVLEPSGAGVIEVGQGALLEDGGGFLVVGQDAVREDGDDFGDAMDEVGRVEPVFPESIEFAGGFGDGGSDRVGKDFGGREIRGHAFGEWEGLEDC